MKMSTFTLTAAALASSCLFGSSAFASPLSSQDAVRLSFSALQARSAEYGIVNAGQELHVNQVNRDNLNQTHVRLDQFYKGIPVFGEQLVTHFNDRGQLLFLNGTFNPMYDMSVRPTISGERALDLARFDFNHEESHDAKVALKVLPTGDDALLVWHIELTDIESDSPKAHTYFINAHTGNIEWDFNSLMTTAATGTGNTLYLGAVPVTTDKGTSSYTLRDPSRGNMYVTDMKGGTRGSGSLMTDSDNVWGNGTTSSSQSGAADAHFGSEMTWDYYKTQGRNGIKGDGKGSLSKVHYGSKYNNAFWSDSCLCMTYGDGDGRILSQLVAIDVAGHEMSHGVTSSTSGLTYSGQSGAMNESFSDIMGATVEFYAAANGSNTQPEYWIGEDIYTPGKSGDALRYMDNPTADGASIDNASQYKSQDVHYTSGVTNNQFYLASEGGTNKTSGIKVLAGIGHDKAAQIWFRANTVYFTASTSWSQGRTLSLKACADLFGSSSTECSIFGQAWTAVGVN